MGITLFAVAALMAPLHQLLGGLSRNRAVRAPARQGQPFASTVPAARAGTVRIVPATGPRSRQMRPLRVVRVAEPLSGPASAGRMVISGRMADVCAELDRLAALEAGTPPR